MKPETGCLATFPSAVQFLFSGPAATRIGGDTLEDAFAQNALGMFGYMTEAHTVDVDASLAPEGRIIEARGECEMLQSANEPSA